MTGLRYLVVDGDFSGTGVRTADGRAVDLISLGISEELTRRVQHWLKQYESAHYLEYREQSVNVALDREGLEIREALMREMPSSKIGYFSACAAKLLFMS